MAQFFLAYRVETKDGAHGRLVKSFSQIRYHYLTTWFVLDFVSCMPFDVLGWYTDSALLRRMKLVRVIRLLRLLKLMKVLKSSRIFKRIESSISISYTVRRGAPTPARAQGSEPHRASQKQVQGLIKFVFLLLLVGHWMACAWVRGRAMNYRLGDTL